MYLSLITFDLSILTVAVQAYPCTSKTASLANERLLPFQEKNNDRYTNRLNCGAGDYFLILPSAAAGYRVGESVYIYMLYARKALR